MAWNVEQIILDMNKAFLGFDLAITTHVAPFAERLKDDPGRAIEDFITIYDRALDEVYTDASGTNQRSLIQALAGGPHEAIPVALYNALGAVYPYLERPQRDRALKKVISIFDGLNYADVNGLRGVGYTTGIREPLLLSDIAIVRPLYWPGLEDGQFLLKQHPLAPDFFSAFLLDDGTFDPRKVRSDFVVAYALLRRDLCTFGEEYMGRAHPTFLERVIRGITGLGSSHLEPEKREARRKRMEELLPAKAYALFLQYRTEGGWAEKNLFP